MPPAASPKKRRKTHREHRLLAAPFVREHLEQYAKELASWLTVNEMHENALAEKVGCSGQQIRSIMGLISAPSFAVAAGIFKVTGIPPIKSAAAKAVPAQ